MEEDGNSNWGVCSRRENRQAKIRGYLAANHGGYFLESHLQRGAGDVGTTPFKL